MDGAKLKALKQIFPELRNFEGRFFGLFVEELQKKTEDWAIWARLELGKKKCSNIYDEHPECELCKHYKNDGFNGWCEKYPQLGQDWEKGVTDPRDQGPSFLRHPNTSEWYWCIKECPDFAWRAKP